MSAASVPEGPARRAGEVGPAFRPVRCVRLVLALGSVLLGSEVRVRPGGRARAAAHDERDRPGAGA